MIQRHEDLEAHPNNTTPLDSPAAGTNILFGLTVTAAELSLLGHEICPPHCQKTKPLDIPWSVTR